MCPRWRNLTNARTVFAVAYSPGLGPIPFTLASESFPLTHREAVSRHDLALRPGAYLIANRCLSNKKQGTAWAISINLLFAGLLAVCFPGYVLSVYQSYCLVIHC